MKINKLILKNYRRFADLEIIFDKNTTVFIGNNGAGKTAILDALVLNLSWLIARINREKGTGHGIDDNDILNGESSACVELDVQNDESIYRWTIAKTHKGHAKSKGFESLLVEVTKLAEIFRQRLTDNSEKAPLPLIVYYPVNRVVVDIPLKIRTRHNFEQIDGYDNALQQGVDFRRFFEWFRDREDVENEQLHEQYQLFLEKNSLGTIRAFDTLGFFIRDKQLNAVRRAIKLFMPNFEDLRVERKPRLRMVVKKNGKKLDVSQLSQGEKSLMSLVGDIARRLAMMNPALENPLDGEGVVLIDEIDMHLHPAWQQTVLANLVKTFPNVQFIVTTHSPQVISTVPSHQIRILDEDKVYSAEAGTQGAEASRILRDVFYVELRAQHLEIVKKLNRYLALIDNDEWDTSEALALRQTLNEWSQGHEPELIKADIDIRMKEFQRQL